MTVFYEHLPIYERNIFYGDDLKAIKKLILKYFNEEDIELSPLDQFKNIHGLTAVIESKITEGRFLGFVMYADPDADSGVVAHEAVHMTNYIFGYICQDLDPVNDEAQAYLVGHFTKTFNERIRDYKQESRVLVKGDKKRNVGK